MTAVITIRQIVAYEKIITLFTDALDTLDEFAVLLDRMLRDHDISDTDLGLSVD